MELAAGAMLGAYRLIERAGRGGMAEVWKGYQASLARYVAIKVLPAFLAGDPSYDERFRREALTISRLRHPNILSIIDFGQQDGCAYMVSEFVDGGTLADQAGRPLPLDYVLRLAGPLASALDYAHARGVIHRDVKPSNVLLQTNGVPVLADFGVAAVLYASDRLTAEGMSVGTPAYMAPEQVAGQAFGPASDLYSFGVVLYELLTGRPPFSAETPAAVALAHLHRPLPPPRSINPALSEPVAAVLLKALAKDPADRFPSARALVEALERAGAAGPADTQTLASPGPPVRPVGHRLPKLLAGLALVALGAGGALLLTGRDRSEPGAPPPPAPTAVALATTPPTVEPPATVTPPPPAAPVSPVGSPTGSPAAVVSPGPATAGLPGLTTLKNLVGHTDAVWGLSFSPDGRSLVSSSHQEPRVAVWDVAAGRIVTRYARHEGAVVTVAWEPLTRPGLIASGSFDGTVRLWDARSGADLFPPLVGHEGPVWSVAGAWGGRTLASGSADGTIRIWTPGGERSATTLPTGHGTAFSLAWMPSEAGQRNLAAGLADGAIGLWDAVAGQVKTTLPGRGAAVHALAWAPGARALAGGAEDGTLRLWDPLTTRTVEVEAHRGAIWTVAWSRDGQLLATGGDDGQVRLWRPRGEQLEPAGALPAARGPVFALAWTRDEQGDLLAIGRQDRQIELVRVAR